MFKKLSVNYLACLLAVNVSLIAADSVSAGFSVEVDDFLKLTNRGANQTGRGSNGEFEVYLKKTNSDYNSITESTNTHTAAKIEDFRTFCVEGPASNNNVVEYFTPGRVYKIVGLGTTTLSSRNPSQNPANSPSLSKEVAALYREFIKLKDSGYTGQFFGQSGNDFKYSTSSDADALQNAIWMLLDPGSLTLNLNNKFVKMVKNLAIKAAYVDILIDTGDRIGGVQIMNLQEVNGTNAQDQLVWTAPDFSTETVPEPGSIVLFGMGIFFAVLHRRCRALSVIA